MIEILGGDCRDVLPTLPDKTFDCVVTSPPYIGQRQYGDSDSEVGREVTLEEYVIAMADIFDIVRQKMTPEGVAWLNIGDKSNASGGAGGDWNAGRRATSGSGPKKFKDPAFMDQSLIDAPGHVLHELLKRGWRLRQQIIWDKGQQARESLSHVLRPRSQHEVVYMLSPSKKRSRFFPERLKETGSVWHFAPGGTGDKHLAPFPDELAARCILPSTEPGDIVLDPFSGSGTTAITADRLGRHGLGIELYHQENS